MGVSDRVARALGWFSLGLGLTELLAPGRITRTLGLEGKEGLVRAYGAREIGSALLTFSNEQAGVWSRVPGDGLDIATVMGALRRDNPKRGNAALALAMLVGITVIDVVTAQSTTARNARNRGRQRAYPERSGFPRGAQAAKGAARDARIPTDMRAAPAVAAVSERP